MATVCTRRARIESLSDLARRRMGVGSCPACRAEEVAMLPSAPTPPRSLLSPAITAEAMTDRGAILFRLRRLEGQVRGVERMVDADASCLDLLTQLAAISSAARAIGLLVL